ncbi:MAG: DNA topoisomerase [Thelocarpon superellum]|nr:MAG: DNA topoisomerase [Thelocarpon superellum]
MARRILCVAEKPSIAKAVAQHLSGGSFETASITGSPYIKNYSFTFSFGPPWGNCFVTMTSVIGHLISLDFESQYRGWKSCPPGRLFDAPIVASVDADKKSVAANIERQARMAQTLFIWTDCDREGEHIGTEIRGIAWKANRNMEVKRAKFSNIERAHVLHAAQHPVNVDERQADAVAARIELDLRIGAALTRLQTLHLQPLGPALESRVVSYGSCQFPTLGFVVDRYFRVKNFVPEPFWSIKVMHRRDDIKVTFNWRRVRLFDRMAVTVLFERCLLAKTATVTKVQSKPTSKWRPLPLTTVDLQMMGTRYLRMDSQQVMKIAEELYTKGFISYPRTETDQFDSGMDLKKLVEKQVQDHRWGSHAQGLLQGNYRTPRSGRNNDQAHPPIHPVFYVAPRALPGDEHRRVYEFVVRRFLACCSDDAKGDSTTVEIQYGDEMFHTNGLIVRERNYLDVYPYDKWESSQPLPPFTLGEEFEPTEATINEGKTSAPGYLTEPDLLALMDANGIGTDATMADHIAKIKEREYVETRARSGGGAAADGPGAGRGDGRGRGRGRGRGGRGGATTETGRTGGNAMLEFIPTTLGVALIEGYEAVGFETSLSKPFLRKEVRTRDVSKALPRRQLQPLTFVKMELKMKAICAGTKTRPDVVHESLEQYREVFVRTSQQIHLLQAACNKYVFGREP